jgi:hypothetical protein
MFVEEVASRAWELVLVLERERELGLGLGLGLACRRIEKRRGLRV